MKYTKLFNQHSEYVAYTASTVFIRPNVSYCILEDEPHCTPASDTPCIEHHVYALVGTPTYPQSIGANDTSFQITFQYSDTYTASTCDTGVTYEEDSDNVTVGANPTTSARTISGTYHSTEYGIDVPYTLTQQGQQITVSDPVISCDGLEITITCATSGADIYYQLDHSGSYTQYTSAIAMTSDTHVDCYAELSGFSSNTVSEDCEYTPTHDYSLDYLTFRITSAGTICWKSVGSGYAKTIEYSLNGGEWTSITAASSPTAINVVADDVIRFKGTNTTYAGNKTNYSSFGKDTSGATDIGSTAHFVAEGNVMSLIYGDNFIGNTAMTGTYNFCSLFKRTHIESAENLVLPSTTLTSYCYRAMFSWCTELAVAPKLPATTLAQGCYWYMFEKCPMTTAPDLPATTLVKECYGNMFTGCNNLNYIKCLATSGLDAASALTGWVTSVAYSGTFIKDSSTTTGSTAASTVWTKGNNGIPTNWLIKDNGTPDAPTISCNGLKIELSCATDGADIYYQLDHAGSYSAYTSAIIMTGDTYIECHAEKDGLSSTTTSQTCEYDNRTIYEYANQSLDTWTRSGSAVTVPNSVNAIDGHSSSYAKGTFNYETSVNLRDAEPTYLWFQHADQSATIYIDNTEVEKHWGGYNAFFVDISNSVHEGTNNIKVALKNNEGNNLAPASGDFNFNATLGEVKLYTSPCLPAMDYGYDGFHITSTVSTASATINVKTNIPVGASVVCTISGTNCNYTATSASTGNEMIFTTTISNPRLWNGTIDPYLYNVKLEVYYNNELYHRYERPYGLRFYEYVINQTVNGNSYTGFLLNGQPYLLRGCCMHDDIAGKANALNDTDYTQQFNLITDLGLNFLRLAHYPHPKEVYDWCDRLGIIVESEVPCVNNLQTTMPEAYWTHLVGQYNDMVNQHYNHPCIMFWGLSNEAKVTDSSEGRTFAKEKIEGYVTQIKKLDNERLVGLVAHALTDPISYFGGPTNIDWIGSNLYEGWYQNTSSNNPTSRLNTCISNTVSSSGVAFAFSEYGCGGTQRCHSESASTTTNKGSGGARHDIEYQMWLHEGHIAAIKNKPQLLFSAQWVLFDFAVSNRNEGYTVCLDGENTSIDESLRRLNDKGLVERDHVTKKDTFYLYKAWWNTADTFVHICGKNYEKIDDRVIKCYTNVTGTLTMYINGTSAATASVTNNIAEFAARDFVSGDVVSVSGSNVGDSFTISGITKKHDYVEIAGTKWATTNIGASSVTDAGLYFQWGDTSGYKAAQVGSGSGKKYFGASDYKYCNGCTESSCMTKYNSSDNLTTLEDSDDAAKAYWGDNWRMPTKEEYDALLNATTTAWTSDYQGTSVSGLVCTDKTDSSKVLFFPAVGQATNGNIALIGKYAETLSKSLYNNGKNMCYILKSSNDMFGIKTIVTSTGRPYGTQIRPVKDYNYVDLGLPSGTKWAKCNVGAETETEYGNYYMYGKGADDYSVTSGQSEYEGQERPLAASADTATQAWGGQWHMPTKAQFEELSANTTFTWETNFNGSGVNGVKFTAQNGNYIFLPAAGSSAYASYKNSRGNYWSSNFYGRSSYYGTDYNYAYQFTFGKNNPTNIYEERYIIGNSIRPVKGA